METILIDSTGYTNRPTLWLHDDSDEYAMCLWEHCTAGFDNPHQIPDSRRQRALLELMFKAHNVEVIFSSPLKKRGK